MRNFNIASNNQICLYGFKIPESAIYGNLSHDQIYICTDLCLHGSGRNLYFMVHVYKAIYTNSVWIEQRKPLKRTALEYQSGKWVPQRISMDSTIGKKILQYADTNPLIIPRTEYPTRKAKRILFQKTRPMYGLYNTMGETS